MAVEFNLNIQESEYNELLRQAVAVIEKSRRLFAVQVCNIASNSYFEIGKILNERKIGSKYGDAVIKQLSSDLKFRYPKMGMSPRNLWDMKRFYLRYCDSQEKLRQCVAVLPWSHNLLILSKNLTDEHTMFYAQETIRKGWSRELLLNAIKMKMHEKALAAVDNNFAATMPATQSKYANEVFRDGYNLGFLGITEPIAELELERRLVEKIKLFLLELGKGFTFIGNQYELEYAGKISRVDMLFFHRSLRCLVAVDLKIGEFLPEYAGKMNYYLSLLDRLEKQPDENPSIGIILCAEKDHLQVELALEDMGKPIGVADYQLIIPKDELQQAISDEIAVFESEKKKQRLEE